MCDVDEGPSAWSETWRTARRSHRCCACDETIRAGDLYHYASGVWDRQGASFKHCARCWEMVQRLQADADQDDRVDLMLDCGQDYEGDDPALLALAFVTIDEGQALAKERKAGPNP